jgi:hypothetical protein
MENPSMPLPPMRPASRVNPGGISLGMGRTGRSPGRRQGVSAAETALPGFCRHILACPFHCGQLLESGNLLQAPFLGLGGEISPPVPGLELPGKDSFLVFLSLRSGACGHDRFRKNFCRILQ